MDAYRIALRACRGWRLNGTTSPLTVGEKKGAAMRAWSRCSRRSISSRADLPKNVLAAEYAVRGLLVNRAEQLEESLNQGARYPFPDVVYFNIGNPQSLGQKPISFFRQVLCLVECPSLIPMVQHALPSDVVERARQYIDLLKAPGTGAYTISRGLKFVREDVSRFISARDNLCDPSAGLQDPLAYSHPDNIFLGDGSSSLIRRMLQLLISGPDSGIMIPIPQYPLYSATIVLLNGTQVPYYLNESDNWSLSMETLEKAYADAVANHLSVKGIVVINPGNPTGQILTQSNMEGIVHFCKDKNLVLIADEVYQENIYDKIRKPFISFKKIKHMMGSAYQSLKLFSTNSASKGFVAECGKRAGYIEMDGMSEEVWQEYNKLCSIELCPNALGQILVGLMTRPPKEGEASHGQYARERDEILDSLSVRANFITSRLRTLEGVTCTTPEGAMYVFPSLTIPRGAVRAAEERGVPPDTMYCYELLEQTGICAVSGSGFRQMPGTYHMRLTFLPPKETIQRVMDVQLVEFHRRFMKKYA